MITGLRYLSARSKARGTTSVSSCTDAGGEHDGPVVAVAAAARGLEVVGLGRGDVAQAGAAAHHVDDDRGQLVGRQVGDALLLEADARDRWRRSWPALRPPPRRAPC